MQNPFESIESINFLDVGCSGSPDTKWAELFPLFSYTGFDPNVEECDRLSTQAHPFKNASYLPYAIAGKAGIQTMHKTQNLYCYSLLRPNHTWLKRFSFYDLFKEVGETLVTCTTLNELAQQKRLKADIIKLDTQGLELPILMSGDLLLKNTFCVETETGFVENYIGETTYAQIDEFMRSQGFLLFDMTIHRVSRKNQVPGKHQPLWCGAVWLFDFVGQQQKPTQEQALKALMICRTLHYFDYADELLSYFEHLQSLEPETLANLKSSKDWMIHKTSKLSKVLKLFPHNLHKRLSTELEEILNQEAFSD